MKILKVLFAAVALVPTIGLTEILSSSDSHFVLRHEASSTLQLDKMWQRLINPADWWHPDHTYSGKAENLSLELRVGGLWREDWADGSVSHGQVLFVKPRRVLRMQAPFGPLQALGAYTVWTITIEPMEEGTRVIFDEVSNAPGTANMSEMAKAVDGVKTEAIRRLTASP